MAKRFPTAEVHLVLSGVKERLEEGVHIHTVPARTGSRLKRMWQTVNHMYEKALSLDGSIYHIHDPELLRIVPKLKRKGKLVIYDAHEDLPRQLIGKSYLPMSRVFSVLFEWYENFIVNRVDAVIAATPFIRDRFQKNHSLVIDINNYPLLSELEFDESLESPTHVCYIGGLTHIRGISQLVDAMQFTKTTLQLAGTLSPSYQKELEQSPGWSQVVPCGHVSRKEALAIKQKAFAGIVTFLPFPNHINSQPNKIFEYMASGIPVIGSNFPLWKELIEVQKLGVCVDPKDTKAIGEAIEYLRTNPTVAKSMGDRGKQRVKDTYNWSVEEEKLVRCYTKILNL